MRFESVKLGDYLYIKGRIGWKGLKKDEYLQDGKYRIINGESLTANGIDWSKAGFITKERYDESPEIMLQEHDILISKDGTIGKIGYVERLEQPTTVASGIFVIRNLKPEIIDTRFIYYFFCSRFFRDFVVTRTEGSVIPHLYQKDFVDLNFPLPQMHVQHKIVSILDAISRKIDLNKRANQNLEQQAQEIFNKFRYSVQGKMYELCEIIDIRDGTHDSPKKQKQGYPLVTSKCLLPFGVDLSSANLISELDYNKINERSKVEAGDILISMIGTIGLISYVSQPANFAIKNVGIFKTSQKPYYALYILEYLKSREATNNIEKCLAGSTQKYISLGELRKLPIWIPDKDSLNKFNSLISPIIEHITLFVAENLILTDVRDALLPRLMSGELDVSAVDM